MEEIRRDIGQWLTAHLGTAVEAEEDFDQKAVRFRVGGTRPPRTLLIPRTVSDYQSTDNLIAALESEQVVHVLHSGEHAKGRLTQHGMQWLDS
jgi:hypothetical protein